MHGFRLPSFWLILICWDGHEYAFGRFQSHLLVRHFFVFSLWNAIYIRYIWFADVRILIYFFERKFMSWHCVLHSDADDWAQSCKLLSRIFLSFLFCLSISFIYSETVWLIMIMWNFFVQNWKEKTELIPMNVSYSKWCTRKLTTSTHHYSSIK